MKKWLALMCMALSLGLSGCAYLAGIPLTETKDEQLHSFLIVQNKLYIVGERHDYQFESDLVGQLNHFLKSPYAKHTEEVKAQFIIEKHPVVDGEYGVFLSGDKLKPADRAKLKADYGFNNASNDLMYRKYEAKGKVVKLENRAEILQKYRFKKPMAAKVIYHEYELSSDQKREIALGVAAAPVMVPLAVVAGVVALPIQLICFPLACGY